MMSTDAEKGITTPANTSSKSSMKLGHVADKSSSNWFVRLNARIVGISFLEERGIQRVPEDARYTPSIMGLVQMSLLWFSINLTANNVAVGLLGPLVYDLGFVDSALCAVFGGMLGGAGAAYMSTYGPQSGNRTMVVARYFMGYYPSKIACLLNIIIMLGYGLIDCLIGGQILSAVSGGSLTVIVGIIIVVVISWVVAVFGMSIFHLYERWAGLPQLIVLFILFGCAGPKFDTSIQSIGNPETINADRLSFFSLCLSASVAWAPSAADYFVYSPASTQKWKTFVMAFTGLALSFSMTYLMGVGLASGTFTHKDWDDAYGISAGALMLAGYNGLGGFGKFCGVIIALGLVSRISHVWMPDTKLGPSRSQTISLVRTRPHLDSKLWDDASPTSLAGSGYASPCSYTRHVHSAVGIHFSISSRTSSRSWATGSQSFSVLLSKKI
jgi:Permease for cytosine/purines, uracil, thiamine, allantoin